MMDMPRNTTPAVKGYRESAMSVSPQQSALSMNLQFLGYKRGGALVRGH
jgi:hypothetical protein